MKKHPGFNQEIETEFQEEFYRNSLRTHRIALWIGIVVYIFFQLLDLGMAPEITQNLLIIRFGVVIPVLLALFAFSFTKIHKNLYDLASSLALLAAGIGVMAVQIAVEPGGFSTYITSLIIVIISAYTLARLRYLAACFTGWVLFAVFTGTALFLNITNNLVISVAFLAVSNLIGMTSAYFNERYMRSEFLQRKLLEQERQRSDRLLLNILPTPVAERLKQGDIIADSYDDASVLFVDIVGFTQWASQKHPEEVLSTLNVVFSHYDKLVEELQLEKIKTIGDAYMVVGGVPTPQANHLVAIATLALRIRETMQDNSQINPAGFVLRQGIQCGPVVAGVIGSKKFIYDLWGDTVNTANRLEFSAEAGRIQVSQYVYERLKDSFTFEERGLVLLKGKGELLTYWLTGKKDTVIESVS